MPIEVYRNVKFSTTHENKVFDELIKELKHKWDDSEELCLILGNFFCKGTEIDTLVIKRDSISVIDFKNYSGNIVFSENNSWTADGVEIKGGNKVNPYQQIRYNKFELLEFLVEKGFLNKEKEIDLGHISGIVMFHRQIEFDEATIPQKIASWFHVVDLHNTTKLLDQITSKKINLSDEELRKFPEILELKPYGVGVPTIDIPIDQGKTKEAIIQEFAKLITIHESLYITDNVSRQLIGRYKKFIDFFYPECPPQEEILYHANNYFNNFDTQIDSYVKTRKEVVVNQISKLSLLISNNEDLLPKGVNNENFANDLSNRTKAKLLLLKFQKQFGLIKDLNGMNVELLKASEITIHKSRILDEAVYEKVTQEILKKDRLINYLDALNEVLQVWFSDDLINQHEYGAKITEYVYAKGISIFWWSNLMNKFNEEKDYRKDIKRVENEELESEGKPNIVSIVRLPARLVSFFKKIRKELGNILTNDEMQAILDLFNLNWLGNEAFDIMDLPIVNLKTLLIYDHNSDLDFLKKKSKANSYLFEPLYVVSLQHVVRLSRNYAIDSKAIDYTYKMIPIEDVAEIQYFKSMFRPYKRVYSKHNYSYSNFLSLYNASVDCQESPEELDSYLISNDKIIEEVVQKKYNPESKDPKKIHVNYYYKLLLKKFKRYNRIDFAGKLQDGPESVVDNSMEDTIVGYQDIKDYLHRRLKPYKDTEEAANFGLSETAGILLYGPPGCGKTHWASWISEYLELPLEEVYRSDFGSSYVDGSMRELNTKLDEIESKAPIAVFFDEFDSIAGSRESGSVSGDENTKVVNTLLQKIPKLVEKGIVILAATNFINSLDSALIRPGRFDLHIPIFPPLPIERAQLLLKQMTGHSANAIQEILKHNDAYTIDYWVIYTEEMYLFSNSHVIDFCEELKHLLQSESISTAIDNILLDDEIIRKALNTVKSKIRPKDVEIYSKFYLESKNLIGRFDERMEKLKFEIDSFSGNEEFGRSQIGFKIQK